VEKRHDPGTLERELVQVAQAGDDPRLAHLLLQYYRRVRERPTFTLRELKSLFVTYNRQGSGHRSRHPLDPQDTELIEHLQTLTEISSNTIEVIFRTQSRATPELVRAQQERALSRQAADIISRLDGENGWLQGQVVQVYFQEGLSIRALKTLVRRLAEHRRPEKQEQILGAYLAPQALAQGTGAAAESSLAAELSHVLDALQQTPFEELDDEELVTLMTVAKRAKSIIEHTQKECFAEVQHRFA
jgi:hypothetical protein